MKNFIIAFFLLCFLVGCVQKNSIPEKIPVEKLFTLLPASYTGIDFINQLEYTEEFNTYTYRNFYNGGGVGLGDLNKDGLVDIYFCGNKRDNRLYLNKGNFQFEDITEKAGVACKGVWSTGVSMADVNGDGWLDIYVCKSGKPGGKNRHNELFINNGLSPLQWGQRGATFTEQSKEWGIADEGLSAHAAFFDYDKDGDLDCYLLNNAIRSVATYDLRPGQRNIRDPQGGNKLYRNDGDHFTDVSEEAGIYGSSIGFGLGVTIGDVNRDGWLDIFVSNDFFERDYLYINQQDGTFSESLKEQIREISLSSMGADMADLNNDGWPEIFVTDMLPEDDARMKTKTVFQNWSEYQRNVKNGYFHQFTRNVLQLNRGAVNTSSSDTNSTIAFSEIGRLAGVYATDWSWSALIFDLDNDGFKDIFVANGIYKDLTDQDYTNFYADPNTVRSIIGREKGVITKLIDAIPSKKLPNYAFANKGDLTFTNRAVEWGLAQPGFSNGSAYADLDNDGDLDLVVNNVNMPPFIYRNEADSLLKGNHFLTIKLVGEGKNPAALGTQVTIYRKGKLFYQELAPMRGYQSCVENRLHFGLGEAEKVDSILINWPNYKRTLLTNIPTNKFLTLNQKDALTLSPSHPLTLSPSHPLFKEVTAETGINYRHKENSFSDFDRDPMIYNMLSSEGPKICTGDVNGDGLEDFFIGGAKDSPGALFIQLPNGKFKKDKQLVFEKDKISEDTDCLFFDADNDHDLDLYVASGGNEFPNSSSALRDRLYLNDGHGHFTKSPDFPARFESTSCVKAADFDKDGDLDLFSGTRLRPFLYGVAAGSFIFKNDGKGNFKDATREVAPELQQIGLITDALWADYDNDGDEDLVLAGEWMPITFFENQNGFLKKVTSPIFHHQTTKLPNHQTTKKTNGFWNCIKAGDFDGDGDVDFVLGNHGQNTRFKASPEKPVSMYVNDFDQNGSAEQIITVYNGEKAYPVALRHDLLRQIPSLKNKYLKYENYKEQTITDIFAPEQLEKAILLEAHTTQTSLLINQGRGKFELQPLPVEAQFAPVYALLVEDFDKDGNLDILLGGNFYRSKPETGIYDASYGLFLKGNGKNEFKAWSPGESGFFVKGEIRDLVAIKGKKGNLILVAKNDGVLEVIR